MKNALVITVLVTLFVNIGHAQVNHLNEVIMPSKGIIILSDGLKINIDNNAIIRNDSVVVLLYGKEIIYAEESILKISILKPKTVEFALEFGLCGLIGAILGTRNLDRTGIVDKKTEFIIGSTVASAAAGALIGSFVNKEKVVYKNTSLGFSFSPTINGFNNNPKLALGMSVYAKF